MRWTWLVILQRLGILFIKLGLNKHTFFFSDKLT